jgi:hypothetical protein
MSLHDAVSTSGRKSGISNHTSGQSIVYCDDYGVTDFKESGRTESYRIVTYLALARRNTEKKNPVNSRDIIVGVFAQVRQGTSLINAVTT